MNILYYKNNIDFSKGYNYLINLFKLNTINKINHKQIKTFFMLDNINKNINDIQYYIYINIFGSSGYHTNINDNMEIIINEPKNGTVIMNAFVNEIIIFSKN